MTGVEPSAADQAAAVRWLGRHGVFVSRPTRLMALRLGVRERLRIRNTALGLALVMGVSFLDTFGMELVNEAFPDLPVGRGYATGVLVVLVQVCRWVTVRESERPAAGLGRPAERPAPRWTLGLLGGWYLTSVAVAYAGGLVLCVALYLAVPASGPTALLWLALLFLWAVQAGFVWRTVVRAPVVAVDPASFMVDAVLRVEDAHSYAPPALLAYLAGLDLLFEVPVPSWFVPSVVAYAATAVGTQLVGWGLHRRRSRVLRPNYDGAVPVSS